MRHHFVPQFLLRAWASGSLDGKVEDIRLDLSGFPSSRRAPKSTGYKDDLYALSKPVVGGMEKQAIEKIFFMQVDNLAARAHQKLVEHGLRSLTTAERSDWVRFLMSLRVRQPDIVQKLKTDSSQHLAKTLGQQPEEYDEIAQRDDAPTLAEWTEQQFPGLIENFGLSFFHEIAPAIAQTIRGRGPNLLRRFGQCQVYLFPPRPASLAGPVVLTRPKRPPVASWTPSARALFPKRWPRSSFDARTTSPVVAGVGRISY